LYRKLTSRRLFNGFEYLSEDAVLILNKDGVVMDIVPAEEAGDEIAYFDGILCPGLINAHGHLELSHLKNKIPRHTGLPDFLFRVMTSRVDDPEYIRQSMIEAEQDMLQAGIVAMGDISNTTDSIAVKQQRKMAYRNFIEAAGFDPQLADKRFQDSRMVQQAFTEAGLESVIVPHAPYSVSKPLMEQIIKQAAEQILTMHNQESDAENQFFLNKQGELRTLYQRLGISTDHFQETGTSSLQATVSAFANVDKMILVHNVFTTEADIEYAKTLASTFFDSLYFCLCPNANQYIQEWMPPVKLLLDHGCRLVLGTDSLASNQRLSIYEEIQTLQNAHSDISMEAMLGWATRQGAIALGFDAWLGTFEKGKQPGVVLLDGSEARLLVPAAVPY
jgi:cytosine/adenosine deaminase-related metal-dependent hydrolase